MEKPLLGHENTVPILIMKYNFYTIEMESIILVIYMIPVILIP